MHSRMAQDTGQGLTHLSTQRLRPHSSQSPTQNIRPWQVPGEFTLNTTPRGPEAAPGKATSALVLEPAPRRCAVCKAKPSWPHPHHRLQWVQFHPPAGQWEMQAGVCDSARPCVS